MPKKKNAGVGLRRSLCSLVLQTRANQIPSSHLANLFLFIPKLGLSNLVSPQHDIQHALHGTQQLLVGRGGPALKVCDDGGRAVALCGEVLLRHGGALVVLGLGARLRDGLPNVDAHRLGLDDVVGAVDLGEALAF